jgi:signal transduction histidine kinase
MQMQLPPGEINNKAHFINITTNKTLSDSLPLSAIDSAYKKELLKNNIAVQYTIERVPPTRQFVKQAINKGALKTDVSFVGLSRAYAYQAQLNNDFGYLLNKIKTPILVSLLLLAFTAASFIFLYRTLTAQQKLTAIKNEFISNITHELKTPIATVTVAVEALRNFNALQNPERTKEYLDISALELQRLSLLVDKVLKLSMFENREIELKIEKIDLLQLAAEVIAGMKLQFDKAVATIQLTHEGDSFALQADKLHITSVLYNLLDNALKYSKEKPFITTHLADEGNAIALSITDNGIGIPAAYVDKIFQKFFRVPSGDHHNIKGYGLGLSYVHHIVTSHNGTINVTSAEGKGSTFTVKLPKT